MDGRFDDEETARRRKAVGERTSAADGVRLPEAGKARAPAAEEARFSDAAADRTEFHRRIAAAARRRRRAAEEGDRSLKSGWGAFGLVGWSIAVPTLLGVAAGVWLDRRFSGGSRWTLSLLALGLVIGMANVWKWMNTE